MSKDEIRLHFEKMSSDELLDIWSANDREQYADQTFLIISNILKERGVPVPPQYSYSQTQKSKKSNIPYLNKLPGFRSGTKWKMIVAGFIYLIIIGKILTAFGGGGASTPTSTQASAPTSAASVATSTPANVPASQDITAVKKQEAEKAVTAFDGVVKSFNSLLTSYQGELQDIGTGTIDPVTGYSDLAKLNTQALNLFSKAIALDVPSQYKDSKDTLQIGISFLQNSINESKNYMDNKKISALATAKDDLQQAINAIQTVNLAVATQAVKDGYTPPSSK